MTRVLSVALLAILSVPPAAARADTRHVLLLYSYEREFAPHEQFARRFRSALGRLSPDPIDFIEEELQVARVSQQPADASAVQRLLPLMTARHIDLAITIGGPAAAFAQKFRDELFSNMPLLLADVDRRFVEPGALTANDTAVAVEHDPSQMVDQILQLLPATRTILVVIGTSQLEQFWRREVGQEFRKYDGRVQFIWTNEWSHAELLNHCASLPPHSAILYGVWSLDAAGQPHVEADTLRDLHARANAPLFGLHSPQLGRGIVGGSLISIDDLSRTTVDVALRIFRGERPGSISTPIQRPALPVFDGRELARWGIGEGQLPAGSAIEYVERSPGRSEVALAAVVVTVPMLLAGGVVALLVRRRAAPQPGRPAEERLHTPPDPAPVRIWTAGPDGRAPAGRRSQVLPGMSTIDIVDDLASVPIATVHPDDVVRCLEVYGRALRAREPFQMEYRVRTPPGGYRRVLDTGAPRFTGEQFVGFVGSTLDLTVLSDDHRTLSSLSGQLMHSRERERAVLAWRLREDICQRMVALTMQLHALGDGADAHPLRAGMAGICAQLSKLAEDLIAISDPLYQKLALLGLPAAVDAYCREVSDRYGVDVRFNCHDTGELPDDVTLTAFRVLEEAVTNAAKHSGARRVVASVRRTGDRLHLDVADDGVGFDVTSASTGGLGVTAIRERVRHVGGTWTLESTPGAGTRVRAGLPIVPGPPDRPALG